MGTRRLGGYGVGLGDDFGVSTRSPIMPRFWVGRSDSFHSQGVTLVTGGKWQREVGPGTVTSRKQGLLFRPPREYNKATDSLEELTVPYVIAEPCIGVKDKSCVAVCPVDCIHDADDQLYIDPNECIDCGLCEPECPVDAIFMEDEVPDQWKNFIQINADYAKK